MNSNFCVNKLFKCDHFWMICTETEISIDLFLNVVMFAR